LHEREKEIRSNKAPNSTLVYNIIPVIVYSRVQSGISFFLRSTGDEIDRREVIIAEHLISEMTSLFFGEGWMKSKEKLLNGDFPN